MCLDAIAEDSVSSLDSGLPDAEIAERVLNEISRDVQEEGWNTNKDEEVLVTPDEDGFIAVPASVLRMTLSACEYGDVVERDKRMYDRAKHTFVFTRATRFDMTHELPFESLPYRLAYYIARRAAREYQERTFKSVNLDSKERQLEAEALARLQLTEEDTDELNVFTASDSVREVAYRYNQRFGR